MSTLYPECVNGTHHYAYGAGAIAKRLDNCTRCGMRRPHDALDEVADLQQQLAERDAEIKRLRGLEAMQRVLAWGGHEMPRPDIYARDMQRLAAAREALAEACSMLDSWVSSLPVDARAAGEQCIADLRKRGGA